MLTRLLPLSRPAWRDTALGGSLLAFAAGMEILQPWPIKWLVDHVFGGVALSAFLQRVAPFLGKEHLAASLGFICGTIIVLAVVHKALWLLSQLLLIRAGNILVRQLRMRTSDHLHHLHLSYHDRNKVGDSVYRLAYDTTCVQSLLSQAVAPVASGILVLIGVSAVMLMMDPMLTLLAVAVAPVYWLIIKGFSRVMGRRAKAYHDNESALASTVTESLSSIRVVQAFTREAWIGGKVSDLSGRSFKLSQRLIASQLAFSAMVGIAMAGGTAAVVYVGANRVAAGRLTVGDILIFLAYLAMLYQPMNAFSQSTSVIQSVKTQLARVFELLDIVPAIADAPGAVPLAKVRGRIEWDDVSFTYAGGETALRKVSFAAEPGEIIALVGRTGAGKSTIASLLLRFYDPTSGAIRLDGKDLRELPVSWLRQQVSIVLQDPVLFSTTIGENIGFASGDADEQAIRKAARRAQVDTYVDSLPLGYETLLGERGVNLSGGQRQRLGIARAFLKDAPILILDEPTSSLDALTEQALVAAIRELAVGKTTFIIAHRLSTVRLADRILVLDKGSIIEQGTHEELLMQEGGAYRRLHRAQSGGERHAGT